uniref:Interleukin 21 n=1 Tax=Tetraodon nigroviridis TaxID=99883 RepID=Q38I21_TETNG|nr:interleukin 21 [Tetraodon nigroviridis]
MKQLVFCLFAVCCWWLADASSAECSERKLEEVRRELEGVNNTLQNRELLLTTPPKNIEEGCCLSALRCFRDSIQENIKSTVRLQRRLYKSLNNSHTAACLNFCHSENATCQTCNSHPQEKVGEFFSRLDSFIQKAISKLRSSAAN